MALHLVRSSETLAFYNKLLAGQATRMLHEVERDPKCQAILGSEDTGKNMMGAYITLVVSGNEAHLKWINGDAARFVETVQDQMEGGT